MCNGRTVEELFDPSKIEKKYLGKFSILVADSQRRSIGNRNENLQGACVCVCVCVCVCE